VRKMPTSTDTNCDIAFRVYFKTKFVNPGMHNLTLGSTSPNVIMALPAKHIRSSIVSWASELAVKFARIGLQPNSYSSARGWGSPSWLAVSMNYDLRSSPVMHAKPPKILRWGLRMNPMLNL